MKRMALQIFCMLVFAATSLQAKDLYSVFEHYLPQNLGEKPSVRAQINKLLHLYGSTDPDILYFYINDLNASLKSEQTPADSALHAYHMDYFNRAKYLKLQWAQLNIEKIRQNYTPVLKAERMTSYFTPSISKSSVKNIALNPFENLDKNKQNFFTYLFLSGSADSEYNPGTDYADLRTKAVRKLVASFKTRYENLSDLSSPDLDDFIDTAFKYPYLFKESYLPDFSQTTDFYIYELLDSRFKDEYRMKNASSLRLSFYPLSINFEEEISFMDYFNDPYKYEYENQFKQSAFIKFAFRKGLKKETVPFSYIDLQIGIPVFQNFNNTIKDTVLFEGTKQSSEFWFTGEYFISEIRNEKSFALFSQVSMPVYYFSNKLLLEAGISYMLYTISYEYDFNREDEITSQAHVTPEFYKNEVVKYDEMKHIILPVISLRYQISRSFDIYAEYTIPYHPRISISYNLGLF